MKNSAFIVELNIFCILQPKFFTKEERIAEALRKRQEAADEARRKMEEERNRQVELMKTSRDGKLYL